MRKSFEEAKINYEMQNENWNKQASTPPDYGDTG